MNYLKIFSPFCVCLLLTACVNVESESKNAVLKELSKSDPSIPIASVKFGKFTQVGDGHACIAVNAPNHPKADSKGDLQAYISSHENKDWYVLHFDNASHEECLKSMGFVAKRANAKKMGTDEPDCKKAVLKSLKDPDSAKFGQFTVNGSRACLTVNARNALGGYTGDQQAILQLPDNSDTWEVVDITKLSHEDCKRVINPFP